MKNNQHFQNNLIVSIVVGVLALIGIGIVIANAPQPATIPAPTPVPAVTVTLPGNLLTKTKGLPENQQNNGQPGAPAGGGSTGSTPVPNGPRKAGSSAG